MKRHLLALALLSAVPMVMTTTAALAQDYHDHDDHGHDRDHHDDHGWNDGHHDHGRHVGWDKHYRRGDYLPERYRAREYYVTDYQRYHLYAPPRGYAWVQGDQGEYVLVAVATGLIVNELLGH